MTLLSVLSASALLVAIVALLRARRLARRLEQVVESYWELRYDYGQLRAQLDRSQGKPLDSAQDVPVSEPSGSTAFVPLNAIRRT